MTRDGFIMLQGLGFVWWFCHGSGSWFCFGGFIMVQAHGFVLVVLFQVTRASCRRYTVCTRRFVDSGFPSLSRGSSPR